MIVRFRDASEKIKSFSESSIIGNQPSRRSLLAIPAAPVTPGARSTPFTKSVRNPDDDRKTSVGKRVEMNSSRLEQTRTFYESVQSLMSSPNSIIDVKILYVHDSPTSVRLFENSTNTDKKPISICTDEPYVTHQRTDHPTVKHDNYAHFISEDCGATNPIA